MVEHKDMHIEHSEILKTLVGLYRYYDADLRTTVLAPSRELFNCVEEVSVGQYKREGSSRDWDIIGRHLDKGIQEGLGKTFAWKLEHEKPYYDCIEHTLRHSFEKVRWYFGDTEVASTRKAVFLSDDCISLVSMMPREKLGATKVTIVWRSCDIRWGFLMDSYAVLERAARIIEDYKFPEYMEATLHFISLHSNRSQANGTGGNGVHGGI